METPINRAFEALAAKLEAVREPEPVPPPRPPVIKGRGGVPDAAVQRLETLARSPAGRAPVSPFGPNVEVTSPGEKVPEGL